MYYHLVAPFHIWPNWSVWFSAFRGRDVFWLSGALFTNNACWVEDRACYGWRSTFWGYEISCVSLTVNSCTVTCWTDPTVNWVHYADRPAVFLCLERTGSVYLSSIFSRKGCVVDQIERAKDAPLLLWPNSHQRFPISLQKESESRGRKATSYQICWKISEEH